jgi:hypothetical protein
MVIYIIINSIFFLVVSLWYYYSQSPSLGRKAKYLMFLLFINCFVLIPIFDSKIDLSQLHVENHFQASIIDSLFRLSAQLFVNNAGLIFIFGLFNIGSIGRFLNSDEGIYFYWLVTIGTLIILALAFSSPGGVLG